MKNPYGDSVEKYRAAGWKGAIPLPARAKIPPPKGVTGATGVWPDEDMYRAWSTRVGNIGLRLHEDILGFDVDHYIKDGHEKTGGDTLAALEARLGKLPPTWVSSSRGDGVNGIRMYRVPPGRVWVNERNIEAIHFGHRYVVCAPSIHPETGQTYMWIDQRTGVVTTDPPSPDDIPDFPEAWVAALDGGELNTEERPAYSSDEQRAVLAGYPVGAPCGHINAHIDAAVAAESGGRHDSYRDAVGKITALGRHGHPGAAMAVDRLRDAFVDAIEGPGCFDPVTGARTRSPWAEFESFLAGALDHAAGIPQAAPTCMDEGVAAGAHSSVPLGRRMAREIFAGRVIYVNGLGWHQWDGRCWKPTTDDHISALAADWAVTWIKGLVASGVNRDVLNHAIKYREVARVSALVNGARTERSILVDGGVLDAQPGLLNCRNGIVDLRTKELMPHDPDRLFTKVIDIDYLDGYTDPDWDKALEALPEDAKDWVQQHFGGAITGEPHRADVLACHIGDGENGKSTLLGAVHAAFGPFAGFLPDELLNNVNAHPTMWMPLRGSRLMLLEELPEGHMLPINRVKKLIDTPTITARGVQRDYVSWTTTHTVVISSNYDPRVVETDHGTWRRLVKVPYPHTFSGDAKDARLKHRVISNKGPQQAVLAWLVQGAHNWYAAKGDLPSLPASIAEATAEWRGESDPMGEWLEDMIVVTGEPDDYITGTDLLKKFKESDITRKKWGIELFISRLKTHSWMKANPGAEYKRIRPDGKHGKRVRALAGARWRRFDEAHNRRSEGGGPGGPGQIIGTRNTIATEINYGTRTTRTTPSDLAGLKVAEAVALASESLVDEYVANGALDFDDEGRLVVPDANDAE